MSERLPILLRPFDDADAQHVCLWVRTRKELQTISTEDGKELTTNILESWRKESINTFVLQRNSSPVAFCTLSTSEYALPRQHIEVCHLVVATDDRRKFFATTLLNYVRLVAAQQSFHKLVGRVTRDNEPGLALARYVHWCEITNESATFDSQYRWFAYALKK